MDSKKPDRRTMKTRRALAEALAELLAAKELHRITVQEIADKADVNRVYFSMMISPYSTATLGYKIGTMFDSTYLAICLERYNITENNTEFEYLCHYHVVGSLSIIEKWARGGYKEPKDLIVQGISDLEKGFRTFCDQKFGK